MAFYLIELNDAAVRVFRDGKLICDSPGVAVIEGNTVITGLEAQSQAHLNPRAVNNRFWQQLNELKLPTPQRHCRHHADLAFHHLTSILSQIGHPSEAVISAPGYYQHEQLALLLGITEACGLKVMGMVDTSVAAVASCAPQGSYTVADIHQHRVTLTTVDVGERVRRAAIYCVDHVGTNRIHEACVEVVADAFLEQSRFDPLHEADTEQLLYGHLPTWFEIANARNEIEVSVTYQGNRFAAKVPTRDIEHVTQMVLSPVRDQIAGNSRLLLSANLAHIPGATNLFTPATVLRQDACYHGCSEYRTEILGNQDGVSFVTNLPSSPHPTLEPSPPAADNPMDSQAATHVLTGNHAIAISRTPIFLRPDGSIGSVAGSQKSCTVTLDGGNAMLRANGADTKLNGESISGSCQIKPGDHISLQGGRALFIPIVLSDYCAS